MLWVLPKQMLALAGVKVIADGTAFVVIATKAVVEHPLLAPPLASVAVTV